MPLGEEMTGMRSLWASSVSSLPASASVTPWPMKITGRLAPNSSSSAAAISSGEAPLRLAPCPGAAGGTSTSSSSWNTLKGTSTYVGAGSKPGNCNSCCFAFTPLVAR